MNTATSSTIKKLIVFTAIISISASALNNLFVMFLKMPGPLNWLCLSWRGLARYYFWQPATFLFTERPGPGGLDLFYLIHLAFILYLLWFLGGDVYNRIGRWPFLRFYFLSGIAAGLITLLMMPLAGQYRELGGPLPPIIALGVLWSFFYSDAELQLFFLIPVQAKWMALGLVGVLLLMDVSNLNLISFTLHFSSVLIGYFYALMNQKIHSPFHSLYRFESKVIRFSDFFAIKLRKRKKQTDEDKIVDFATGNSLKDDDRFIDSMLEKISKFGENSLTRQEKDRMQKISQKKRKKKQ